MYSCIIASHPCSHGNYQGKGLVQVIVGSSINVVSYFDLKGIYFGLVGRKFSAAVVSVAERTFQTHLIADVKWSHP